MGHRHVFGPVPSRRLGFSLGIDIIPSKYCNFDCIYCQLGKTVNKETERRSFYDPSEIVEEAVRVAAASAAVDVITFSGSGEPTLNSDIGRIIRGIKERVKIPVAVITNSSLFSLEEVREDVKNADVVLPSLDAVSEEVFRYVNRPHSLVQIQTIIEGLRSFRSIYRGKIWLEIMMLKNINNDAGELAKIKETIAYLQADKVQINTVTRPPSEKIAGPVDSEELNRICAYLGGTCEVICSFEKSAPRQQTGDWAAMILDVVKRRPLNLDDIVRVTGIPLSQVESTLRDLEKRGEIRGFRFDEDMFYQTE
jgi:wyosine [tRNA(Phe)-imidazoG37] synthetase (radical SAM superfamily)